MGTTIDRDLLRKAWPDGYLGMRGVRTVGNWQCVWEDPPFELEGGFSWLGSLTFLPPSRRHSHPINGLASLVRGKRAWTDDEFTWLDLATSKTVERLDAAHEAGNLLPNVDPEDVATWACLLSDLAQALVGEDDVLDVAWRRATSAHWRAAVTLGAGHRVLNYPFDIDTDDPALALVLARIQMRERE